MTLYGIIGDIEASPKLVRAAMSDLLETHLLKTPDEEFWLILGVRKQSSRIYGQIMSWAEANQVYYEIIHAPAEYTYHEQVGYTAKGEPAAVVQSDRFMLDVVERCFAEGPATILALVGDVDPRVDVLRAIAKGVDNGTEVRDLAEAGLTYIQFHGDTPPNEDPQEEPDMPTAAKKKPPVEEVEEEEISATLEELGAYADDEDDAETAEEAQALLTQAAEDAGLDIDEFAESTWSELAEAIAAATEEGGDDEDELTEESLADLDLAGARKLGKALGIENAGKMRRDAIVDAIKEAKGWGAEEAPKTPAKKAAAKKAPAKAAEPADEAPEGFSAEALSEVVDLIADAVIERLVARLAG